MLQPILRWKSIVETEPELVLAAAISYQKPHDRLICRDCDRPYRSTRAGFTKRFFCPLSRKKEKRKIFAAITRETYSEIRDEGDGKGGKRARAWVDEKGLMTKRKLVLHYKAGGPWQWEMLRKREYASAHLLYELSNYIIIRRRPRSATRGDATGGSLNSITRAIFARNEISFASTRSLSAGRSAIKCARTMGIWKYDLTKG